MHLKFALGADQRPKKSETSITMKGGKRATVCLFCPRAHPF
jgi:hypothetical protein